MAILIYGKNPIHEALKASRKIQEIYTLDKNKPSFLSKFKHRNIKTTVINKQQMDKLLPPAHQGIGALVEDYQTIPLEKALKKDGPKVFLMLDSIEDPHNFGAILRSADAFGITGVIIPKHRSVQITPTVVKVSTGAIEYVDIIQVTNLNQTIKTLKEHHIWVVGTDAQARTSVEDIPEDIDVCVVLGSEGKGLSQLVRKNCDYLVNIPMVGHVNSLNVSVSCGIILHDITKRRL